MRVVLLAGAVLLGAAAAHASSIDKVHTSASGPSIEQITCVPCGPYAPPEVEDAVQDVELAPGQQKIEIREVDGEKKIYRTEAWFGGSPVVMVSKMPGQADAMTADKSVKPDAETPVAIDPNKTTSVTADMTGQAQKLEAKAFNPAQLELRLK